MGKVDCLQFGLGWVAAATGRELVAPFYYSSAAEAREYLIAHGGLERVVGEFLEGLGFKRVSVPEEGDVAVVPMPTTRGEEANTSVVIRSGPWWVGKTARGLAGVDLEANPTLEEVPTWRII